MIEDWGWDNRWAASLASRGDAPQAAARVTGQERERWALAGSTGRHMGRVVSANAPRPVVGDWVVAEPGPEPNDPWSITDILPRRTVISRATAQTGARPTGPGC